MKSIEESVLFKDSLKRVFLFTLLIPRRTLYCNPLLFFPPEVWVQEMLQERKALSLTSLAAMVLLTC